MGIGGYKIRNQNEIHFITFAVVMWIDVFSRQHYRDIVVDSLRYCQKNKGLLLYAWVIMSSHVHMIVGTKGVNKLEDIIRDLKRHTSKRILETIKCNPQESRREWIMWMFERAGKRNSNNKQYQFWQQNNHPIELSDSKLSLVGHLNLSFSSRLYHKAKPVLSQ